MSRATTNTSTCAPRRPRDVRARPLRERDGARGAATSLSVCCGTARRRGDSAGLSSDCICNYLQLSSAVHLAAAYRFRSMLHGIWIWTVLQASRFSSARWLAIYKLNTINDKLIKSIATCFCFSN